MPPSHLCTEHITIQGSAQPHNGYFQIVKLHVCLAEQAAHPRHNLRKGGRQGGREAVAVAQGGPAACGEHTLTSSPSFSGYRFAWSTTPPCIRRVPAKARKGWPSVAGKAGGFSWLCKSLVANTDSSTSRHVSHSPINAWYTTVAQVRSKHGNAVEGKDSKAVWPTSSLHRHALGLSGIPWQETCRPLPASHPK